MAEGTIALSSPRTSDSLWEGDNAGGGAHAPQLGLSATGWVLYEGLLSYICSVYWNSYVVWSLLFDQRPLLLRPPFLTRGGQKSPETSEIALQKSYLNALLPQAATPDLLHNTLPEGYGGRVSAAGGGLAVDGGVEKDGVAGRGGSDNVMGAPEGRVLKVASMCSNRRPVCTCVFPE
jgi:hypothetical protein